MSIKEDLSTQEEDDEFPDENVQAIEYMTI